jgi:hypothetical protein
MYIRAFKMERKKEEGKTRWKKKKTRKKKEKTSKANAPYLKPTTFTITNNKQLT